MFLEDEADIAVVGEAGDGVEAIYATQLLRPDVLLLELAMPPYLSCGGTASERCEPVDKPRSGASQE